MSEDEFDWHASELAKTNPNVVPPELPDTGLAVAGEVEGKTEAPELVEISTIRVLGDIGTRLDAPAPAAESTSAPSALSETPPRSEAVRGAPARGAALWMLALAGLGLAGLAWALLG